MRRKMFGLLATPVVLLMAAFSMAPAQAAGAFTQTVHVTSVHDEIPLTCAGPFTGLSVLNATGNGVQHLTVNGNGSWFTTTFSGNGTLSGAVLGEVFTGKVTEWFGDENNDPNAVDIEHATFNFDGVAADGTVLHLNAKLHVSVVGGVPKADRFTVNCH